MTTAIQVNKLTVKEFLEKGKSQAFVIPEYQRPYEWTCEHVETLFLDLWEFANTKGGSERDDTYFLGSVVSYVNEDKEQEIIDGQQRITSLFLLLRAIYTKLKQDEANKKAKHFIQQIEPALWRTDKLTGQVDYSNILLQSKVINNEGNRILRKILSSGEVDKNAQDNYSKNYLKFIEMYEKVSSEKALAVFDFIFAILNQAILLPISADKQDTALTIFSTLNNRGLPLSDADIFKAKIYNNLTKEEKSQFIKDWQLLDEESKNTQESIQKLFYYYMFYLRAKEGDSKSTTPGIRTYYAGADNKFQKLNEIGILDKLNKILNLWKVINNREVLRDESNNVTENWSKNTEIIKALDILNSYPNEYWKYPVINYYLSHSEGNNFEDYFLKFLHKLISELLVRYLFYPTLNFVKSDIIKLNISVLESTNPNFNFSNLDYNEDELKKHIKIPKNSIIRMLLKILAYQKQDELLPEKWEIEHIFPQKWQNNFILNLDSGHIKEKIEHIGNKLPFEKRLNIIAGNGYFAKKQEEYEKSKILITKEMSKRSGMNSSNDWILDDISERDTELTNSIIQQLLSWSNCYQNLNNIPTEEDLRIIQKFKENGWV